MRRLSFPVAILPLLCALAGAEPASPWASDLGAAIRLVDAGSGAVAGERLAGIAIRLQPGWKTYWRQPGASGAPPRFDFSTSDNVAAVRIAYPTPERSVGEDGVTNVYHGAATLPLSVTPRDPSSSVVLRVSADIGVCEAVCVPMHADLSLRLAPGGGVRGPAAADVRAALLKAPKPAALGAGGPLAILGVSRSAAGPGVAVDVAVAAPEGGAAPALFAETGEGDYVPAPELVDAPKEGRATFRMTFDEDAPPASGLRLTLAAGDAAIETAIPLDAIAAKP